MGSFSLDAYYPGNPRDHRAESELVVGWGTSWGTEYIYPLEWTHPSQTTPANRLYFRREADRAAFRRIFEAIGCTVVSLSTHGAPR